MKIKLKLLYKLIPNWTRNRMITNTNIRSANKFKQFVESRAPNSPIASLHLTSQRPILDDKNKTTPLLWERNSIFIFIYCIVVQPSTACHVFANQEY